MGKQKRASKKTGHTPNRPQKQANMQTSVELKTAPITDFFTASTNESPPAAPPPDSPLTQAAVEETEIVFQSTRNPPATPLSPSGLSVDDSTSQALSETTPPPAAGITTPPRRTSRHTRTTSPGKTSVSFGQTTTKEFVPPSYVQKVTPLTAPKAPSRSNPASVFASPLGHNPSGKNPYKKPTPPSRPTLKSNKPLTSTRYTLRFHISRDDCDDETLLDAVSEFFDILKRSDPAAEILPWYPDATLGSLSIPDDLPRSLAKIRQYFERLQVPRDLAQQDRRITIYSAVFLRSSLTYMDHRKTFSRWPHEILYRELQSHKTQTVGWALYSTPNMDLSFLTSSLRKKGVHVHCRYHFISQENGRNLRPADKVKAIHFEVDAANFAEAKTKLYKLYAQKHRAADDFPANYRLRLIPDLLDATQDQKRKLPSSILRQQTFLTVVSNSRVYWPTQTLDHQRADLPFTLRKALMDASIGNRDNKAILGFRVFNNMLVVDHLLNHEIQAKEILFGIVPYVRWLAQTEGIFDEDEQAHQAADSLFSSSQIQEASGKTWCPQTHRVLTDHDEYLEDVIADNDLFDLSAMGLHDDPSMPDAPEPSPRMTPRQRHVSDLAQGRADDSITTFHPPDDLSSIRRDQSQDAMSDDLSMGTLSVARYESDQQKIANALYHIQEQISKITAPPVTQVHDTDTSTTPSTLTNPAGRDVTGKGP